MHKLSQMSAIAISTEEAEYLLSALVAIPSPSGQEKEASCFLVDWMAEHGFYAFIDESGSAVGMRGKGQREIVLLGHIDTFPGEVPFRLHERKLYGRGSVDAKGALVAFVIAASQIEPPLGTRLIVIGATEEESATSRGARHALERFRPSACIIGEPSGWEGITLAYKGRLVADWSWHGPLAHSTAPIPSPAEQAVAYWLNAKRYTEQVNANRKNSFDRLDLSLQSLNTGLEGAYGVAEMQIGLRLPTDLSPNQVEGDLRSLVDGAEVRFSGQEHAFMGEKNNALVRAMLRAVRAQEGCPRFVLKTGTSDMNVVGPVWCCPIVAYGPGDSKLDHTPEEHLDLDEYHCTIAVLRHALEELLLQEW